MKKWGALVLALLMMTVMLAGCGEQDPEKEAAKVVAEVNGVQLTKGEAMGIYDWLMDQTVIMYEQSGYTFDREQKDNITLVKQNVLQIRTEDMAIEQKLAELGQPVTEEDQAAIRDGAQADYDMSVQQLISSYGLTEEDAKIAMDDMGYSLEALNYLFYHQLLTERAAEIAGVDVAVAEDDIKARYDTKVQESTDTYTETPTQYITDVLNGSTVYAQPEGIRFVKNIVIGFSDDTTTKLSEKSSEYNNKLMEQYTLLMGQGEDATEEQKAADDAAMQALTDEMTQLNTEMDALMQAGYEEIRANAEDVLAQAKADGADFDALIAQYSKDIPTAGIIADLGYPVHADTTAYVPEFTEASMALPAIGDVSDLVGSDYGFHILQYASNGTPGATPYENVKSILEAEVLAEKQNAATDAKVQEWVDGAKVKTYLNRF